MRTNLVKKTVFSLLLLTIPSLLFSQMWDYEKSDIEDILWNETIYVENSTLPIDWDKKSAVILDYKFIQELKETSLTGLGHSLLKHSKIKLLDNAAIENYSEFYFYKENIGFYRTNSKSLFGVRIIKPNGDVIIIDTEKEMIVEKNFTEVKKKIAIPNLQVGDIIDYYTFNYVYNYQKVVKDKEKSIKGDYYFIENQYILAKKYPIFKLKYEIITDRNWKVTLKNLNNCPEINELKKGENEYRFIIEANNTEPIGDFEWDYVYRTRPSIKIYVDWEPGYIKKLEKEGSKYYSTRELNNETLKNNVKLLYDEDISGLFGDFMKYLKKNNLENLSKERKIEEYFYYLRHRFVNMHLVYDAHNYNSNRSTVQFSYGGYGGVPDHSSSKEREISHFDFCRHFIFALKRFNIDYDYLLAIPREDGDISELLSTRETIPILKINFKTPKFIYFDGKYSRYNLLPESIEGVNCMAVKKSSNNKDFNFKDYQIPASKVENNLLSSKINVSIADQSLEIDGDISIKGKAMIGYQNSFVSIFDFVFEENIKYNTKRWGDTTLLKDGKLKNKIMQMHQDDKVDFKETFDEYITDFFQVEELELNSAEKIKIGVDPQEDEFQVKYNVRTNELINKIGNNYIFKIGKLTGDQIEIKDDEMHRDYDVYVPHPVKELHQISFTIPDNFEVKGIDNLNKLIENEYGKFKSDATVNGNVLVLNTEFIIKTNFINSENWLKLVEILNAAFNNQQQEILLKKI